MGKLKKFDVVYDNTSAIFYPSQRITGQVIVVLSEPMEMRGIEIEYNGIADIGWTDETTTRQSDGGYHTQKVLDGAASFYLMESHKLFGFVQENSDHVDGKETSPAEEEHYKNQILPNGEHTFRFSYTLRDDLPSSFEGTHGYVRYNCRAVIHRPWKFNSFCKMPFTIVSVLDLNQQPGAMEPVTGQADKLFSFLCCTTGSLSVTARIDRKGYVPGESISLNAEIDNLSNRKISYSKAFLKSKITYHGAGNIRTEIRDITEVERGPTEPRQSDVWNGELIPIPSVAPSFLSGCKIINLDYYVEVAVFESESAFILTVTLPIIIGTIPLKQYFSSFPPKSPTDVSTISAEFSPSATPLPYYPDAPLPSYAECELGQVSIRDNKDNQYTYGKLMYAPFFTYYNLSRATPKSV